MDDVDDVAASISAVYVNEAVASAGFDEPAPGVVKQLYDGLPDRRILAVQTRICACQFGSPSQLTIG